MNNDHLQEVVECGLIHIDLVESDDGGDEVWCLADDEDADHDNEITCDGHCVLLAACPSHLQLPMFGCIAEMDVEMHHPV